MKELTKRSFAMWLQDLVFAHVAEDGETVIESLKSFESQGLPGVGFSIRIDGKEFSVQVSQVG